MRKCLFILWVVLFLSTSFADTLILKNGKQIEGTIINKTKEELKMKVQDIEITYWVDEIERINGEPVELENKSPLESKKTKEDVLLSNTGMYERARELLVKDGNTFTDIDSALNSIE